MQPLSGTSQRRSAAARFAQRLRAAKARKGIGNRVICEAAGIPRSNLGYYLTGRNLPTIQVAKLLADVLDDHVLADIALKGRTVACGRPPLAGRGTGRRHHRRRRGGQPGGAGMRYALVFLAGLAAGILLVLLASHPATSRQASTPRPVQFRPIPPVATARPAAPTPPASPSLPSPATGTRPALVMTLRTATPPQPPSPRRTALRGVATWMPERYGSRYLALPSGAGHRVRICGAGGCLVITSTDSGPSLAMQRAGRIADIGVRSWEGICGLPRSRGVCRVTIR
jgi:transcriptional regulator with XRE-family HTH domain